MSSSQLNSPMKNRIRGSPGFFAYPKQLFFNLTLLTMSEKLYKIGIIDDEDSSREILTGIISFIPGYEIAFSLGDPFQALHYIEKFNIDILFLDIEMRGFGGLEIAKRIESKNIPIILCTAHDKYGVQSYKYNVVYYIIKIANDYEVSIGLEKAKRMIEGISSKNDFPMTNDFIFVKVIGEPSLVSIYPIQIRYIEQKLKVSNIHMESGEIHRVPKPFYQTLELFNRPYLHKIHRSFAVNHLKIKSVFSHQCILENGAKIPIGEEYHQSFFEFLTKSSWD